LVGVFIALKEAIDNIIKKCREKRKIGVIDDSEAKYGDNQVAAEEDIEID